MITIYTEAQQKASPGTGAAMEAVGLKFGGGHIEKMPD